MITLTRLDGTDFILNADLIEIIEATPDTVISFAHDKKVLVREKPQQIVERIIDFRRRVLADPSVLVPAQRPTAEQTSFAHKGQGTGRFRLIKQDGSEPS